MWVQSVRFTETMIYIALSDGREVGLPLSLPWLAWLAQGPRNSARAVHWSRAALRCTGKSWTTELKSRPC